MTNRSCDPKNMKHGQIAGNRYINAMIYHCFEYICEEDERKFVKKFHEQPADEDQIMHTFRELILGAYLSSNGFNVRYDYTVSTKTPDWCILDETSAIKGTIELTNFHIDRGTENEIEEQLQARGIGWVWPGPNDDRLYHCIWYKAQVYKALIEEYQVPYVIAVFGEFRAAVDYEEELCPCLLNEEFGLFRLYPEVSGVLYFEENSRGFLFNYVHNPNPLRGINLPCGVFQS
jgi:hypothetical protein